MKEQAIDLNIITVRSFRWDPKKARTTYAFTVPTEFGSRELSSSGDSRRPHPDLLNALASLSDTLAKYDETKDQAGAPVEVLGVTVAESDERVGFKLTGRQAYRKSHGFRVMNPPLRFEEHADARQAYTKKEVELIGRLVEEVEAYIRGKAGDPSLFDASTGGAPADGEPGGDTVGRDVDVTLSGSKLVVDGKEVF